MSAAGKALLDGGWVYMGLCGSCKNRMKKWVNPEKKGEEIKCATQLGWFYHYVGNHIVKTDRLTNLPKYLETLNEQV